VHFAIAWHADHPAAVLADKGIDAGEPFLPRPKLLVAAFHLPSPLTKAVTRPERLGDPNITRTTTRTGAL
jgi:hypothetical protein